MSSLFLRCFLLTVAICLISTADTAPFFDAIYAALTSGSDRSYNGYYDGYYNQPYQGRAYQGYGRGFQRRTESKQPEKSYTDICRVHNPTDWQSACPWN